MEVYGGWIRLGLFGLNTESVKIRKFLLYNVGIVILSNKSNIVQKCYQLLKLSQHSSERKA